MSTYTFNEYINFNQDPLNTEFQDILQRNNLDYHQDYSNQHMNNQKLCDE